MSRDKQIEEMAKLICSACRRELGPCNCEDLCRGTITESNDLYNAGYRKASEVAEDIIRILRAAGINKYRYPVIAEIEKKYMEVEE